MIYRLVSRIYPKKLMDNWIMLLNYANIKTEPQKFAGFLTLFGFAIGLAFAFWLGVIFKWNLWLTGIASFFAFEVTVYLWLTLSIDAKSKFIEKILPDVLQLMSSNMRAGLTPDRALLLSARPEFGILNDEINRMGKEITTGTEIGEALMGMTRRVRSEKLDKTVSLIVSGLKSGGELASLLDQTAKNLRDQEFVEQKIKASVGTYVIFIFAAVCFGAPLLYALSTFLVEVLTTIMANIEMPDPATLSMPLTMSKVQISVKFIMSYVIISIVTTSILGSFIMGLITNGAGRQGLKYAPIMIAIGLLVFFTVRYLISSLMSGLLVF